jgi:hypothetical protein
MDAMQTLGLSGEAKRSDGRLKSIFWPTVENAWDVDYLGRQGFWICLIVATVQIVVALVSGSPIMVVTGVLSALVFGVGGMGVRESSWPAAALVFCIYFVGLLYNIASGQFPGFLAIIVSGLLLSNLRAAFLASEWRPAAEGEDRPTRFNEGIADKLVDQLPAKAWRVLQIPFFGLASLLLLLSLAGLGFVLLQRFGVIPQAVPL